MPRVGALLMRAKKKRGHTSENLLTSLKGRRGGKFVNAEIIIKSGPKQRLTYLNGRHRSALQVSDLIGSGLILKSCVIIKVIWRAFRL